MRNKLIAVFAVTMAVTVGAFAAKTKPQPKITMAQARATALAKAPGSVTSEELENEHGKLIYSFDIAMGKDAVTEVNVDAINGKIVAVQHENAAKEKAEAKQEAKEKKNAKQ